MEYGVAQDDPDDHSTAVSMVCQAWQVDRDEGEELLSVLCLCEARPESSVLFPERRKNKVEVTPSHGMRSAWLVLDVVCEYAFLVLVVCTNAGRRFIAEVWPLKRNHRKGSV